MQLAYFPHQRPSSPDPVVMKQLLEVINIIPQASLTFYVNVYIPF